LLLLASAGKRELFSTKLTWCGLCHTCFLLHLLTALQAIA
jgi:hypothetical protein